MAESLTQGKGAVVDAQADLERIMASLTNTARNLAMGSVMQAESGDIAAIEVAAGEDEVATSLQDSLNE